VSGGMPPDTLAGDLGGGIPAQFRVRPNVVVIVPPGIEHEVRVRQRREQRLVAALVAQAAIEALHEAVLHRLPRCDVVPLDPAFLRPTQDGRRGQLGPVIADYRMRFAAQPDQPRQFARDPHARQ